MTDQRIFFLTTIPGLESATHLELCDKWGRAADFFSLPFYPKAQRLRGGVEFEAPLAMGFLLNLLMRTNTRMLLRENSFAAGHEKEFIQGLQQISWSNYFGPKSFFDFKFTSKSSKLSMKNQIEKCLTQVLKKQGVRYKSGAPTIFVRIFRDECNISFDLTGEGAFKRGAMGSVASLRSSTAQGLLRILLQGLSEPFDLIDPMCGSGTFLTEALSINKVLQRHFSFMDFPLYQQHKQSIDKFLSQIKLDSISPQKVFGLDNNQKALDVAQKNLEPHPQQLWHLQNQDLFAKEKPSLAENNKRVVVLNPPWGKRLPAASQDILKSVYDKYQPDRIGLLMPAKWRINPIPLEKVRDIPILNSGVENRFLVFA